MPSYAANDEVQDFLGKGDNDTASEGQEPVGALAGVVALERKADLDDAPPEKDDADSPDQAKDKGAEMVTRLAS